MISEENKSKAVNYPGIVGSAFIPRQSELTFGDNGIRIDNSLPPSLKLKPFREEILDKLASSVSLRKLAKQYGVAFRSLHNWLNNDDNYNDYQNALQISADAYADRGEECFDGEQDKDQINQNRFKAEHLRWLAENKCPQKYGKRVQIAQRSQVDINFSNVSNEALDNLLREAGQDVHD